MITIPNIEGQTYAVLGLGKSGLAAAASLRASKARVVVWDDTPETRAEAARVGYEVADLSQADMKGFQALVLSPGIPHTHPAPHPVVERFRNWRGEIPSPTRGEESCRSGGIPIIGDIELLFRACPKAAYVGITGTNGKSTTTALIGHILAAAGRKVQVGGNLGTPVLSFEPLGADGIYVLELSSYQLELMRQNLLTVAVLLNITPDHIDRHGDIKGYIAAKARIFTLAPHGGEREGTREAGRVRWDSPFTNSASPLTPTPLPPAGGEGLTLVIGTDEPETLALMMQARQRKNIQVEEISVKHAVAHGVMVAGQQMFSYTGEEEGGLVTNLGALPTLPGKHNWQNACAAFAACRALGVPDKQIVQGLKTFPGLAHRQQLIAEIDGVRFINDSKATNADAAGKALACYDNIYWIIGGRPKEGGLSGLEEFVPRIRHAFLIGEAAEGFAKWCEGKIPYTSCGTLDVAVEKASIIAWKERKSGSVVLLSPACASWDQFSNFEERGRMFGEFVKKLGAQHAA